MNVYDIITFHTVGQTHCVVAENMGKAEELFEKLYWPTTIKEIRLHSEYVQIQEETEG